MPNAECRMPNGENDETGEPQRMSNSFRSFAGSFLPGDDSTPEDTSIAAGLTVSIASATFNGFNPPDRITGRLPALAAAMGPGSRFATGRHVDRRGPDSVDRLRDIQRVQPARQNHGTSARDGRGNGPID